MATPSTKEVNISNNDIWLGYSYDESTGKFTPSKKGRNVDVEELPIKYKLKCEGKHILDLLVKSPYSSIYEWAKDYCREDAIEAVMVKGVKILEKRGINVQTDDVRHTVTSVLYKSHVTILLLFSQAVSSNCADELEHYLLSILSYSNESFLPQSVSEFFHCAYIYQGYGNPGIKVNTVKHCLSEYCRILTESKVSTIPLTALIEAPCLSHCESKSNLVPENLNNMGNAQKSKVSNSKGEITRVHSKVIPEVKLKVDTFLEKESGYGVKKGCFESGRAITRSMTLEHHGMVFGSGNRRQSPASVSFGERFTTSESNIIVNVNQENYTLQSSFQSSVIDNNNTSSLARKAIHDIKETDSKRLLLGLQHNENQENPEYISSHQSVKDMETNSCINSVDTLKEANCKYSRMQSCVTVGAISHTVEQPQGGSSKEITTALSVSQEKYEEEKNSEQSSGKMISNEDEKATCDVEKQTPNNNHGSNVTVINKLIIPTKYLEEELSKTKSDLCHEDVKETTKKDADKTYKTSSQGKYDNNNIMYPNQTDGIESGFVSEKNPESSTHKFCCHIDQTWNKKVNVSFEDEVSSKRELLGENELQSAEDTLKNIKIERNEMSKDKTINSKVNPAPNEIKNAKAGSNDENRGNNKSKSSKQMMARNKDIKSEIISGERNPIAKGKPSTRFSQSPHQSKCITNKKCEQVKCKVLKSEHLKPIKTVKDQCGLERKYYFCLNEKCEEKVILLLGASGSGKTMLVNFVANYFTGKKSADDKLVHVETSAPTSAITAYTFCADEGDIPITIIDTPGLNDSSGSEVRDHVLSLKTFLANASSRGFEIHAIGFVAQAYLVRLTSSERLVMNYVSTMFGQSISNHLISLVTFADNQDTPPVVEAMKNYGVKSNVFLKFNNSALNNSKSEDIDDLDRAYWRICWRNWKKCLKTMRDLPALSINTMKAVQSEVYAATVIESAEKELRDEMSDFFSYCKEGNRFSKKAGEVCEKVWSLTAIIHRFRIKQNSASCTISNIIIEYAVEACKMHNIAPEKYVNCLLLCPTQTLVVSGSTIIRTVSPLFEITKRKSSRFHISKSISEWAYCLGCKQEHAMLRAQQGWVAKFISKVGQDENVVVLKCKTCNCPANCHGVSGSKSPLHCNELLDHTINCLRKVLQENAFPKFPLKEKVFLEFLNKHLELKYKLLIEELLKRY